LDEEQFVDPDSPSLYLYISSEDPEIVISSIGFTVEFLGSPDIVALISFNRSLDAPSGSSPVV
jgi:hypothetical protein